MSSAAGLPMMGGGGVIACAVCMLKCKCPLLRFPRYTRNYEPASEVLILMALALMAFFFFEVV